MTPSDDGAAGWSRGLMVRALVAGALSFGGGALAGEALMRGRGAVPHDTANRSAGPPARSSAGPPVKEAPVKEAPVKEAPVKEAPVKEAPDPETPPRAETLALLSPLAPGKDLDGCVVSAIAERSGVIRVRCGSGSAEQRLGIALTEGSVARPPATAGPFAVYYASSGSDEAGLRAAQALAAVLAAHAPLEAPPWLRPLRGVP